MAYARFSNTSRWYIYRVATGASSAEQEQLELDRVDAKDSVRLSFAAAEKAVSTRVLPIQLSEVPPSEEAVIFGALARFVADVREFYSETTNSAT